MIEGIAVTSLGLTALAVIFVVHFLPAFIAFYRKHPNRIPILLVNIFFGWTGLGWIVALIWSFTNPQAVL
jgi:hypothetical protein